ncbi:hypothetical protein [Ideonella sp.]|jgi:hypothetical protein|uniref:hypothetical protein n=1 Tax=Ideonella sp. TaxID=1929293 RepID=UPI0037BEB27A
MNPRLPNDVQAELLKRFARLFAAYRRADKNHRILKRTFHDLRALNPIRAMAAYESVVVGDPCEPQIPTSRLVVTDYTTGETLARSLPQKWDVLEVTEGDTP